MLLVYPCNSFNFNQINTDEEGMSLVLHDLARRRSDIKDVEIRQDTRVVVARTPLSEMLVSIKGCGMGPWLVLVSPCFRENVVATCKIVSFLGSLDNLLGNQISKWRSFEKRAIFDLLFTFFSHQGKVTKIPSAHISLTYIHTFCSTYWLFLPYQFWKKYEFIRYSFSLVWVPALILICAILEQSINNKMMSKI